jgi:hypothetical protein
MDITELVKTEQVKTSGAKAEKGHVKKSKGKER